MLCIVCQSSTPCELCGGPKSHVNIENMIQENVGLCDACHQRWPYHCDNCYAKKGEKVKARIINEQPNP